jgi:hypothetical protein
MFPAVDNRQRKASLQAGQKLATAIKIGSK